jgi:NAD(P)-dependent dehydrogenase (short-subunit alcohol dehydrogenase family)
MQSSIPLEGRTIAVTGGAQGIGLAFVKELAERGAAVIIGDVNAEKGAAEAERLAAAGYTVTFLPLDLASEESCGAFAGRVAAEHDTLDGLINNAAMFSRLTMKPFWEIGRDEWEQVHQINLTGTWMLTKALRGSLVAGGGASVVNMSSGVIWIGRADYAHYVSSKAGVLGLSRAMARELGDDNVRVNVITPGAVRTEVPRETVSDQQWQNMVANQCIKRVAEPRDLVGVAAFLLSEDSSFITGQVFNVDGGLTFH